MKNWISYFYGINIENIHHIKNRYKFKYNDNNYVFEMISVENDKNIIDKINDIYRFNMYLLFNGIKCSEIIVNKNNEVITYIEDISFWLIAGCILLYSIFVFNNGELRLYIFIGLITFIFSLPVGMLAAVTGNILGMF